MGKTFQKKHPSLFLLDDLSRIKTLNYSEPTLVREGRFSSGVSWNDSESFRSKLIELYPAFKSLSLKDLAIVGGSVVDILSSREPKDIDMYFLLGSKQSDVQTKLASRVEKFVEDLIECMKSRNKYIKEKKNHDRFYSEFQQNVESIKVSRYRGVYTIQSTAFPIPIQISATTTIEEHFEKIDIKATAVAYLDEEVCFSEQGKFSFENQTFYINETCSNPKYIKRVIKYFEKGFDVILPNLKIDDIPRRNLRYKMSEMLELPFMLIEYKEISGNKINVEKINFNDLPKFDCGVKTFVSKPEETQKSNTKKGQDSATYSNSPFKESDINAGYVIHYNISKLIRDQYTDFITFGEGEHFRDALVEKPIITERMLVNSYETIVGDLLRKNSILIPKLKKFFTCKKISEILLELFVEFYQKEEEKSPILIKLSEKKFKYHCKNYFKKLKKLQIDEALIKLKKVNEMESLEGSDRHEPYEVIPIQEWYGDYLKV